MSLNYSFAGKRVLVTGGASGIGKQLVKRFSDGEAIVFTVDKNAENLEKLKAEYPNVTTAAVDLANWQETRNTVESFGHIDHLVNNAGMVQLSSTLNLSEESLLLQFQVMTGATLNVTQVVAKEMIKSGSGGSVVNIASVAAHVVFPNSAAYSVAKAGVENLTKSLAVELGAQGIRVNGVAPGFVDTPIIQFDNGQVTEAHMQLINQRTVAKRLIDPNEIADLVLFLLSPLSTMIVGQTVVCDGGLVLSL